ncbi:uroporphyrinogen-III synthase [bacterium]|nr:uroporphyrinogen-III synthase [bacterium]
MEMKSKSQVLSGRTVVITRPKKQAKNITSLLENQGATVINFPTIEISEPASWELCDRAIQKMVKYDGIIFTSSNAVRFFLNRVPPDVKTIIEKKSIYVVGDATKQAVESYGLHASNFGSNGAELAQAIARLYPQSSYFLFIKGNLAGQEISRILNESCHRIDEAVVYCTNPPSEQNINILKQELIGHKIDMITFFSPSSIRNFFEVIPAALCQKAAIAVIGPTTEQCARDLNIPVSIVAQEPSSESLTKAIAEFYYLQTQQEHGEYSIVQ